MRFVLIQRGFVVGLMVVVVLLLVTTFAGWYAGRAVSTDILRRDVSSWAVTPGERVRVNNRVDLRNRVSCHGSERPLDIILIIDRSSSMGTNDAQRQATQAVVAFAEVLAGTPHQIAVIAFNERAQTLAEFDTPLPTMRDRLATLSSSGTTQIGGALILGGELLARSGQASHRQVIVLLSDGGAQDAQEAIIAVQRLRQQGIHLITVFISGEQQMPDLLQSLASTPDSFFTVADLLDLTILYRNLADSIRAVAASDLHLQQPFPERAFSLGSGSVIPGSGVISESLLSWSFPIMMTDVMTFTYDLIPKTIGWHTVAEKAGMMSMIDCTGSLISFVLPLGPRVLVTPLPWWALYLIAAFSLVPLFLFDLGRRRKDEIGSRAGSVESIAFEFRDKGTPTSWLDNVPSIRSSESKEGASEQHYADVLVVGIGRSGLSILSELRRSLCQQMGGVVPSNIRLLSINTTREVKLDTPDTTDASAMSVPSLALDETLTLTPDLQKVVERLQSRDPAWSHLQWWANRSTDDVGRAGARMALFYDLLVGEEQSLVWKALRKRLQGLKNPLIYVVASLAVPEESGMALDLPHFIMQASHEMNIDSRRRMALFFLQNAGTRIVADGDAGQNTYAALRELQRILLRERFAFEYNPGVGGRQLIGSTDSTPIDACYLLDGIGDQLNLSQQPEEQAIYPLVADALLTLISTPVAQWHQDYVNKLPASAERVEQRTGLPTVSSLGCSVLQFPIAELKHILKIRFLLDLVFGGIAGNSPLGFARLDPGSKTPVLDARAGLEGMAPRQRAMDFLLRGGQNNRHPLMDLVARLMNNEPVKEEELNAHLPNDRRIDETFCLALRDAMIVFLNGTGGDVVANRSGKLGGCLSFLSALADVLKEAESLAPRRLSLSRELELGIALASRIANWQRTVKNTYQEAKKWERAFVRSMSEPSGELSRTELLRRHRQTSQKRHEALYDILCTEHEKAQAILRQKAQPPHRTLVDYDLDKQDRLYQRHLGPERLKATGLRPLEDAMRRIGWWCQVNEDEDYVALRLCVLPPDMAGQNLDKNRVGLRSDQGQELYSTLIDLAEHFVALIDTETMTTHVEQYELSDLANLLLQGEKPLIKFDRTMISQMGGNISTHLILTSHSQDLRDRVAKQIGLNLSIAPPVEAFDSNDPYRVSLVGLTDIIPIESIEALNQASLDYSSDVLTHVFMAEQIAAQLERNWRVRRGSARRFHPRFVRLLENQDLLRAIALADFYGLLERRHDGQSDVIRLPISLQDRSAVEWRFKVDAPLFDVLHSAFDSWLTQSPEHPLSRRTWPRTRNTLNALLDYERRQLSDAYTFIEAKRDEVGNRLGQRESNRTEGGKVRSEWEEDVDVYLWLLAEDEKRQLLNR